MLVNLNSNFNSILSLNDPSLSYSDKNYNTNKDRTNRILENIKEYCAIIRETGKALQESKAIPELAFAIKEVAQITSQTAKEISKSTHDIKLNQRLKIKEKDPIPS